MNDAGLVEKHSIVIAGHRTSISLERAFWVALTLEAARDARSVASLVALIDAERGKANLSSAIRVHLLQRLQLQLKDFAGPAALAG